MKISKKLVKRVLKVALVMSCTFLLAKQVEANTVYKDLKPNKIRIINGNYAETYGGAIEVKEGENQGDIIADFIHNSIWTNNALYIFYTRGGAISNEGTIKSISGNFTENYIEISKQGYGAAIYNAGTIGDINSNFTDNYMDAGTGYGAAIYNSGSISNIIGDFIGNKAQTLTVQDGRGGAIYNKGNIGNISGKFYNNYASKGGAIFTTTNLQISADGSNEKTNLTDFSGNYTTSGENNAIYVGANSTITLKSVNGGTVNFDDTINGSTKYNLKIQGDNTSKVILNNSVINANASLTDTNLYISETAFADTRTNLNANSGTVHFANGKSENYQINQLTSLESANYTVDVDLTKLAPVPDTITTGAGSSGTVTISDINFNGELKDFNAQILKAQDDNIQLGLSDNLKDKYNTTSTETIHTNDTVQANVNWKDKFNKYEQINTTTTGLSLGTTNTTNDSIEYSTKTTEGEKVVSGSMGDTLALVNQLQTQEDRNFYFDTAQDTYVVSADLGQTSAGKLSVNGIKSENSTSTVDLNAHKGFELTNNSTLVINNTKLTGNENLVTVTNSDAVVELNNAYINGNITGDKNYAININGEDTTTINGNVNYANTTLTNGTLKFNSNTFADITNTLNVKSGNIELADNTAVTYNINNLNSNLNGN